MNTSESSAALLDESVSASAVEQCWHFLTGKRRSLLVDRSYQLRVSLMSLLFVLALLVPLNVAFYYNIGTDAATLQAAPELRTMLIGQDRAQFFLVLLGSVVFLAGHFLFSILETHRTAGAAFALERHLRKVEQGRYGVSLQLRKGDNLLDLEGAFNRMSCALRERALAEVGSVEALAEQVQSVRDEGSARETAARLRMLADGMRKQLS